MPERRLMERLSHWEQQERRSNQPQQDALVASVRGYLTRILNARQGSVPIDQSFGVPDFANMGSGLEQGAIEDISAEICRMVQRYEPRLSDVSVKVEQDESSALAMLFRVIGNISLENKKIPLTISAELESNGRIRIR
jgi:type VI secretion system protein